MMCRERGEGERGGSYYRQNCCGHACREKRIRRGSGREGSFTSDSGWGGVGFQSHACHGTCKSGLQVPAGCGLWGFAGLGAGSPANVPKHALATSYVATSYAVQLTAGGPASTHTLGCLRAPCAAGRQP